MILVLLIASVVAMTFVLRPLLHPDIFDSHLLRVAISVVLYGAVLQAVVAAGWALNHNLPLHWMIPLAALVVATWFVASRRLCRANEQPVPSRVRPFRAADLAALGAAAVTVILVLMGPSARSAGAFGHVDADYLAVTSVANGVDDGRHFAMVNDHLRLDRGIPLGSHAAAKISRQDDIAYPRTMHAANAAVVQAAVPTHLSARGTLRAYVMSKLVLLAMATYLLTRLAIAAFGAVRRKLYTVGIGPSAVIATAAAFFGFYILLSLFKQGFYTFLGLELFLFVLGFFVLRTETVEESGDMRVAAPAGLAATGAILCWPLVGPGLAVAFALVTAQSIRRLPVRKPMYALGRGFGDHSPLWMVCGAAVLVQAYVQVRGTASVLGVLAIAGGFSAPSTAFNAFVALGVVSLLLRSPSNRIAWVLAVIAGLTASVVVVFAHQIWATGDTSYYGMKLLEAATTFALPFSIAGWAVGLGALVAGRDVLTRVACASLALACLFLTIGLESGNHRRYEYIHGERMFSPAESRAIVANMDARSQVARPRADAVFFDPDAPIRSALGTNLLQTIQPVNACDRELGDLAGGRDASLLAKSIRRCQHEPITIITTPAAEAAVRRAVRSNGQVSVVAPCSHSHHDRRGCGR